MKFDSSKVILIDEFRVTFDGPDGWAKGWTLFYSDVSVAKRRQQKRRCVMIWNCWPIQIHAGVRLNNANNCDFPNKTFFAGYKSQSHSFKKKCVFMHKNDPFTWEKIMEWLPSISNLNPIENLWSILEMKLYESGKNITENLTNGKKLKQLEIKPTEVKILTKSMYYWLQLRRMITVSKHKGFKDLYLFIFFSHFSMDQFLIILLPFYWSKCGYLVLSNNFWWLFLEYIK